LAAGRGRVNLGLPQELTVVITAPPGVACPWCARGVHATIGENRRMPVGEFDLIAKYFSRPVRHAVLGGGDDCALLQPRPGMLWAVSTDALVEGRHFLSTVAPEALGHKALAVNLSDLAACGAQPVAFTLSLTLPRVDEEFLAGFAAGMYALADAHGIELVGGDTTAGPLTIGITVMGEVPPGQALRRGGARAGDDVWVSGRLGDARLALEVFRGKVALRGEAFEDVRRAMERPQPRVALGLALRGVATAAIDLSDGLAGDLGHVLRASGVGATLRLADIPHGEHVAASPEALRRTCLLGGGDDYELAFCAAPADSDRVRAAAARAGVAATCIGTLEATPGLRVVDAAGAVVPLAERAFDHFIAA
jgi:thiamine-monophosphate kinase